MPAPTVAARRPLRRRTARDIELSGRDALMAAVAAAVAAEPDRDVQVAMTRDAVRLAERWGFVSWPGLFGEGE